MYIVFNAISFLERILCLVRKACGLVVADLVNVNTDHLEDLKECLSVVTEGNSAVMRIALFDEDMTIETSHLADGEYADAAEGPCSNRKYLSLCNISAELVVGGGLQAVECDLAGCDIALKSSVCNLDGKITSHDLLILHLKVSKLL